MAGDEAATRGTNRQAAPRLDVHAFTVALTRQQLAEQVWRYTDGIAKKADTVMAEGRALYDLLLAPAADRLAGRTTLVIVPDDALWTLPFEALMPADGRYLIEDAAITLLPSAAAWLSRPEPAAESPLTAIAATGEVSDIVPFQTRLTFPTADVPPLRPGTEAAAPAAATRHAATATTAAAPPARTPVSADDARGVGAVRPRSHDARPRAGRRHAEGGAVAPGRRPARADGTLLGAAGRRRPTRHLLAASSAAAAEAPRLRLRARAGAAASARLGDLARHRAARARIQPQPSSRAPQPSGA